VVVAVGVAVTLEPVLALKVAAGAHVHEVPFPVACRLTGPEPQRRLADALIPAVVGATTVTSDVAVVVKHAVATVTV
jgi:hypothetical protein